MQGPWARWWITRSTALGQGHGYAGTFYRRQGVKLGRCVCRDLGQGGAFGGTMFRVLRLQGPCKKRSVCMQGPSSTKWFVGRNLVQGDAHVGQDTTVHAHAGALDKPSQEAHRTLQGPCTRRCAFRTLREPWLGRAYFGRTTGISLRQAGVEAVKSSCGVQVVDPTVARSGSHHSQRS